MREISICFLKNSLLQSPLKHFLEVEWGYPRCLEGPPTSMPCNAPFFMVIRSLNPFLLKQTWATGFFQKKLRQNYYPLWSTYMQKRLFFSEKFTSKRSKEFLEVVWSYWRYLEDPPTSELCNALTLMVIWRLNHFLLKQTRAGKGFFKKQGRSFSHIDSQNINFSRNFCFRALQKIF